MFAFSEKGKSKRRRPYKVRTVKTQACMILRSAGGLPAGMGGPIVQVALVSIGRSLTSWGERVVDGGGVKHVAGSEQLSGNGANDYNTTQDITFPECYRKQDNPRRSLTPITHHPLMRTPGTFQAGLRWRILAGGSRHEVGETLL